MTEDILKTNSASASDITADAARERVDRQVNPVDDQAGGILREVVAHRLQGASAAESAEVSEPAPSFRAVATLAANNPDRARLEDLLTRPRPASLTGAAAPAADTRRAKLNEELDLLFERGGGLVPPPKPEYPATAMANNQDAVGDLVASAVVPSYSTASGETREGFASVRAQAESADGGSQMIIDSDPSTAQALIKSGNFDPAATIIVVDSDPNVFAKLQKDNPDWTLEIAPTPEQERKEGLAAAARRTEEEINYLSRAWDRAHGMPVDERELVRTRGWSALPAERRKAIEESVAKWEEDARSASSYLTRLDEALDGLTYIDLARRRGISYPAAQAYLEEAHRRSDVLRKYSRANPVEEVAKEADRIRALMNSSEGVYMPQYERASEIAADKERAPFVRSAARRFKSYLENSNVFHDDNLVQAYTDAVDLAEYVGQTEGLRSELVNAYQKGQLTTVLSEFKGDTKRKEALQQIQAAGMAQLLPNHDAMRALANLYADSSVAKGWNANLRAQIDEIRNDLASLDFAGAESKIKELSGDKNMLRVKVGERSEVSEKGDKATQSVYIDISAADFRNLIYAATDRRSQRVADIHTILQNNPFDAEGNYVEDRDFVRAVAKDLYASGDIRGLQQFLLDTEVIGEQMRMLNDYGRDKKYWQELKGLAGIN